MNENAMGDWPNNLQTARERIEDLEMCRDHLKAENARLREALERLKSECAEYDTVDCGYVYGIAREALQEGRDARHDDM